MATPSHLAQESVWTDKSKFEDAEAQLHAQLAKSLEQPVAVAEVQQQPLPVSNQNDQGPVEAQTQPDAAKPASQEPVTEQQPPAQEPQPLIAEAPALLPAPEQFPAVVAIAEKPAEECPHLKKKDDAEEQQPTADTNVKEKKQKKAKTSSAKEPVAEEAPQPQEQSAPKDAKDVKDSQPQQQQASSKAEKKPKEKHAPKEKQPQSEKSGKQKKQAKDKQDVTADSAVESSATAEPVPEAQSDSRKKGGKKKEEKHDGGGEEKKPASQKGGAAKKGKQHGDKVIESTPPQAQDSSKAVKEEKAEKARTGACYGKSSLTDEIARARLHIKSSLQSVDVLPKAAKEQSPEFAGRLGKLEAENAKLNKVIENLQGQIQKLESRLLILEAGGLKPAPPKATEVKSASAEKSEEDEDVDLFGASDEDSAEKERLHQERVKAYTEKKSKKPALIAKSSVILDVKPWDDETDMKEMERSVREIQMDGLVWGASKLVPLAFGIHKLQIGCVVEDEKVSIDLLQEQIQEIEKFVQSADVAAFNKV